MYDLVFTAITQSYPLGARTVRLATISCEACMITVESQVSSQTFTSVSHRVELGDGYYFQNRVSSSVQLQVQSSLL